MQQRAQEYWDELEITHSFGMVPTSGDVCPSFLGQSVKIPRNGTH
jgi:hypothetical protein